MRLLCQELKIKFDKGMKIIPIVVIHMYNCKFLFESWGIKKVFSLLVDVPISKHKPKKKRKKRFI